PAWRLLCRQSPGTRRKPGCESMEGLVCLTNHASQSGLLSRHDWRKSLMKRALLAFAMVAAMCCLVSSARAQAGVNLAWTNCAALGGLQNRTFACTGNTGNHILAATFVLPADVARVAGDVVVMDLISQSSPLPPW